MSHIKINNSRESLEEYLGLGLIEFAVNGSEGVIMEALGFGDGNDEERCDQLYNTVTSWAQCFKESWDEFHEENDDPSMEEEDQILDKYIGSILSDANFTDADIQRALTKGYYDC